jgi:hypothetical protein
LVSLLYRDLLSLVMGEQLLVQVVLCLEVVQELLLLLLAWPELYFKV